MKNISHMLRQNGLDAAISVIRPLAWSINKLVRHLGYLRFREDFHFTVRPSDIYLSTFPKSGTTWLQMIVHQLTSNGSMEFDHINEISPWFDFILSKDRVAEFDRLGAPRFFKTHLRIDQLPRSGRYIYMVRRAKDVAVSLYHQAMELGGARGTLSEFIDQFIAGDFPPGRWLDHVASGLEFAERHSNVLLLTYEDLSKDLATGIKRISNFLGMTVPEARMEHIVKACGFESMKAHENKFKVLPNMRDGTFIRRGQVGGWKNELSPADAERLECALRSRLRRIPRRHRAFVEALIV